MNNDDTPRDPSGDEALREAATDSLHILDRQRWGGYLTTDEIEVIDALRAALATPASEGDEALRKAANDAKNALALTYNNVPADGSRPHWCRFTDHHDATCSGMLHTQDALRAALATLDATRPSGDEALRKLRPFIRHRATCYLQAVRDNAPDDDICDCGLRETWAALATPSSAPDVEGLRTWASVNLNRDDMTILNRIIREYRDSRS